MWDYIGSCQQARGNLGNRAAVYLNSGRRFRSRIQVLFKRRFPAGRDSGGLMAGEFQRSRSTSVEVAPRGCMETATGFLLTGITDWHFVGLLVTAM